MSEIRKVQDSTWKLCAACDSRCLSQGFWVVMVAAEKKKQKKKKGYLKKYPYQNIISTHILRFKLLVDTYQACSGSQ